MDSGELRVEHFLPVEPPIGSEIALQGSAFFFPYDSGTMQGETGYIQV